MKCIDCHNLILFKPGKGFCVLAKQFLDTETYNDDRVSCDFWRPYQTATIKKNGKLQYIRVDNDNLHDDDAEELGE